ncbi:zinc finger, CCHC-type containing protein [Tanacetum coccineum]
MAATMKHMALNFAKLDKFEGVDFQRWQKKMHLLLSSMSVVYVLTTLMFEDGGYDATVEQIKKWAKWDNDDYVKDASSKKLLVSNFTNYKITDSKPVMEQYNKLLGILDFKHTLKFLKEELTLVELGSHLRIKESLKVHDNDKPKGSNVAGPYYLCDLNAILSFRNKKYFVTFIDDAFRTDRGGEYMDTLYYQSVDVIHEMIALVLHNKMDEAVLTACYLLNRVPNKRNRIPPYEILTKRKPNLNYLRVWGYRAVVRLPDPKLKTLGERGIKCIFVGYAEHSKAFRFYVIKNNESVSINSIIDSRDAIFDENRFSSVLRPSLRIPNGTEDIGGSVVLKEVTEEDVAFWKEAINDEMDSIMGNNTWVLADLPPGCKPLGCKWIFKRKLKVDGTIEKFKARLVIQGFKQKSGIDYFDTYAPVARISTIRLLIAMASIHNLIIHQMDVKTAFLNGELDEEVYMNQPQGFIMPGNENKVCKLIKSLYGLKQAPKQWHQKFDEVVLSNGYLLNQADKCVYSKFDETGKGVIICLYVDDMLIFGTDQVQVDLTKEFLSSKFSIKDMGEADVILGIRIKHESNGIAISQSHYIEKVLKKFNYFDCTLVSIPMDTSKKPMPNSGQAVSQLEYSRVIGCLMYAMTCTRLDISFAVAGSATLKTNRLLVDGFLLGGGVISWASKKQTCITGSIMEYEFVALAAAGKEAKLIDWEPADKEDEDDTS